MITRWFKKVWKNARWIILGFLVFTFSGVLTYAIIRPPFTPLMFTRIIDQLKKDEKPRIIHKWVPIEEMSPYLIQAAVAAEDNNFATHFGVDFEAIRKAQQYNERKKGRKVRGASTITQQTCKNVFLWPTRSYIRKGFELYFTFMVETVWTKKRIMEVYLNMIEMGDGVYGAEAASQKYFKKSAKKLTKREAALIVAAFPNPRKYKIDKPGNYLLKRQETILRLMRKLPAVEL
ncbi:MAG TPA: monofunctional biosynthetic peptidoglycan transglycosylase [Bacteroidales bacterium]|nr:monofunctional biosynthetic peptidoglycan transglycosylase [Bacteroidales bacterium]